MTFSLLPPFRRFECGACGGKSGSFRQQQQQQQHSREPAPARRRGFCADEKAPDRQPEGRPPARVSPAQLDRDARVSGGGRLHGLEMLVVSERRDVPVTAKTVVRSGPLFGGLSRTGRRRRRRNRTGFCPRSLGDPNTARRFTQLVESADLRQAGKGVWRSEPRRQRGSFILLLCFEQQVCVGGRGRRYVAFLNSEKEDNRLVLRRKHSPLSSSPCWSGKHGAAETDWSGAQGSWTERSGDS